MIAYTPTEAFTDSDIYDLSDFVIGGLSGTSNVPLKALLDRSLYLRNRLARFEGVKQLTGNYTFDTADIRKAFSFHISANTTFNLPDGTTLPDGYVLPISTVIPAIKALTVQCYGSQKIADGADDVAAMYMHDGERLVLAWATDHWEILHADGNFKTAGQDLLVRKLPKNSLILQGSLVVRADVPRLSAYALSLASGQSIVDDAVWLSDPGGLPRYRGCYSYGNTVTTIRIPDERGLHTRALDLGRGLDNDRLHNYPGGYEHDQMKKFWASNPTRPVILIVDGDGTVSSIDNRGANEPNLNTSYNIDKTLFGTQVNVKNIGKIPGVLY